MNSTSEHHSCCLSLFAFAHLTYIQKLFFVMKVVHISVDLVYPILYMMFDGHRNAKFYITFVLTITIITWQIKE